MGISVIGVIECIELGISVIKVIECIELRISVIEVIEMYLIDNKILLKDTKIVRFLVDFLRNRVRYGF